MLILSIRIDGARYWVCDEGAFGDRVWVSGVDLSEGVGV